MGGISWQISRRWCEISSQSSLIHSSEMNFRRSDSETGRRAAPILHEDFLDHTTVDVGQTTLDSVVVIRQRFVIDAEQLENGGVEVGPGDRIFDGPPADIVCFTVSDSLFESRTGQPAGEAFRIVVRGPVPSVPLDCVKGVRPNSDVQRTIVSSNIPRCFRSEEQRGRFG